MNRLIRCAAVALMLMPAAGSAQEYNAAAKAALARAIAAMAAAEPVATMHGTSTIPSFCAAITLP